MYLPFLNKVKYQEEEKNVYIICEYMFQGCQEMHAL